MVWAVGLVGDAGGPRVHAPGIIDKKGNLDMFIVWVVRWGETGGPELLKIHKNF